MAWDNDRTNFERNLAVVIGIDRYDSRGIHNLQTAVSDANAIANLLRDEYGYKDEHIVRLFSPKNDEATLKALNQPYRPATLDELRILLTDTLPNHLKPTPADRLLFYFAGHGIPSNSKDGPAGYLVPQTAQQGNPDSFLSMRELHDALKELECHHLLVILDCCYASTFRWASSRKAIPILETVHCRIWLQQRSLRCSMSSSCGGWWWWMR
ncbi:caspase family protein [Leptolyngbya sp. FACHB-671]|uniref:caspase family protein n=1 Tax=Leptolyngbya sp. FACHB-671 TaxID=2692812 RepID=UPI0016843638|nr:caspase family protein [Leptolyngbya sp. FACHB-671]MBD2065984.1 caspase family protein [Leptolyngbya sp. FACHB-671]